MFGIGMTGVWHDERRVFTSYRYVSSVGQLNVLGSALPGSWSHCGFHIYRLAQWFLHFSVTDFEEMKNNR